MRPTTHPVVSGSLAPVIRNRALRVVLLGMLVVLCWSGRADAHAQLESTDPASDAALQVAPSSVRLTFSERVQVAVGGIRLFDQDGRRVDVGTARTSGADGDIVEVPTKGLRDGTYVVGWRVVSADSHPVHGAFAFHVGPDQAASTSTATERALSADGDSAVVVRAHSFVRFLSYVSLLWLAGAALAASWFWPRMLADRWSRRAVIAVGGAALVCTVLAFLLQGVYGAGLPMGSLLHGDVVETTLHSRFGTACIARALALVIGSIALWRSWGRQRARRAVAIAAVVAWLAPSSFTGHAAVTAPAPLSVLVDLVHLLAVAAWIGVLPFVLRRAIVEAPAPVIARRGAGDPGRPAPINEPSGASGEGGAGERASEAPADQGADGVLAALRRFSSVATACVIAIVATGALRGWQEVHSTEGLLHSGYGRLLTVKAVLFLVVVVAGWRMRTVLRARGTSEASVARHRWLLGVETAVAVVVLAVTSLLVDTAPPTATAAGSPFATELQGAGELVDVTVDPARTGPAEVHVYVLSLEGALRDVPELRMSLTLPSRDVGPLEVPLQHVAVGHFTANAFRLPFAGRWGLDVTVRTSDIDQEVLHAELEVR